MVLLKSIDKHPQPFLRPLSVSAYHRKRSGLSGWSQTSVGWVWSPGCPAHATEDDLFHDLLQHKRQVDKPVAPQTLLLCGALTNSSAPSCVNAWGNFFPCPWPHICLYWTSLASQLSSLFRCAMNDSIAFWYISYSSTEARKVWKWNIIWNEHHDLFDLLWPEWFTATVNCTGVTRPWSGCGHHWASGSTMLPLRGMSNAMSSVMQTWLFFYLYSLW